jgi:hypothetical protein
MAWLKWIGLATALPALAGAIQAPSSIAVEARARSVQPGELVVLTITTPSPVQVVRVRAFDHAVTPYQVDTHRRR